MIMISIVLTPKIALKKKCFTASLNEITKTVKQSDIAIMIKLKLL